MKWLSACLAVLFIICPAMAGDDPYVAIVGNDINANTFYLDPQYQQFLYDQTTLGVPVTGETFDSSTLVIQPEVCDIAGQGTGSSGTLPPFYFRGKPNARATMGNTGFFAWTIRLPKKPAGEINLCVRCGILKPNAFALYGFSAVQNCAAETGERVGPGACVRTEVSPGTNPLLIDALPTITATVTPGTANPNQWTVPWHLTAFKNPSYYNPFSPVDTPALSNNANAQVLDGSVDTRILLKSCMEKCLVVKLPVTGQYNALGETEYELEAGDLVTVRMDISRRNTVDIYCHEESLQVKGIGSTTVASQIFNLKELVAASHLPAGITASLDSKLSSALLLQMADQLKPMCNTMGAFINETSAQSGKHLTSDAADRMMRDALSIKSVGGCQ